MAKKDRTLHLPEDEAPRRGRPGRAHEAHYILLDIGGLEDFVRERAEEEHTSVTQYIRSLISKEKETEKTEAAPSQD